MYDQNEQNLVIRTIRTMISSPLFLVGAIGYSVYALFELLGGLTGGDAFSSLINGLSWINRSYSMDYSFTQAYLRGYNMGRVIIALIMAVPVILIVAGIWLSFASAKSNSQPGISITGLTMIRIIVIIQLVFACLGLALLELLCIVGIIGANAVRSYYSSSSIGYMVIIMMIGIAVFSAVKILYYLKLGKTINVMKEVIISGRPNSQISLYVEIFCYIAGGVAAVSALVSLAGMSVYGFLAKAGLAAADISFAIFLRKYRGNMERLIQRSDMTDYTQNMRGEIQPSGYQPYQGQVQPGYQPYQGQTEPGYQPYQGQVQPGYQPYQGQAQPGYQPYQEPVQPIYSQDNETTVLPYYNETSVLSGQLMTGGGTKLVRMTRQKTGETICISKPSFWIGKDAANVDYCITDNTAVSRRHALVTIQNNNCYVRDNHSTNRLFINGQVIQADVDTLLSDGDRIRMGDEEFVVSIS